MTTHTDHNAPYISVVVAARNDNHGGNMLGRMQAFVDSWIEQTKRYGLPSEIIVVEWNPPAGRPKLVDALRWPNDTRPCRVRFIEVSPEVHRTIPHSVAIPLHQMIAKNVGIRRALGQFVLATNLDIIFSADLMRFLAQRRLERGAFYRMDRHDVASEIPSQVSLDELLAFCDRHVLRVFAREGAFDVTDDGLRPVEEGDIVAPDSGIRLGAGWYGLEWYDELRLRYIEPEAEVAFVRPPYAPPRLIIDAEVGPSARTGAVEVEIVDPGGATLASALVNGRCRLRLHIPQEALAGRFRLRVRGGGVPLTFEPRMLDLRVFGLRWGNDRSGPTSPSVDTDALPLKEFLVAVDPEKGAYLDTLDFTITDGDGNVATMTVDQTELAGFSNSAEYRIKVTAGFRASAGGVESLSIPQDQAEAERPRSNWRLELIGRKAAVDWTKHYQRPSQFAAYMRNPAYLHTNACGDFTLLSRNDWFSLRAYPEFPVWPMHVDSLFCYSAHHAGLRETILRPPMRIFHIQHLTGAGWTPEGEKELNARVAAKGVPVIEYQDLLKYVNHMRRFDTPIVFSGEHWGLADLALPETTV